MCTAAATTGKLPLLLGVGGITSGLTCCDSGFCNRVTTTASPITTKASLNTKMTSGDAQCQTSHAQTLHPHPVLVHKKDIEPSPGKHFTTTCWHIHTK